MSLKIFSTNSNDVISLFTQFSSFCRAHSTDALSSSGHIINASRFLLGCKIGRTYLIPSKSRILPLLCFHLTIKHFAYQADRCKLFCIFNNFYSFNFSFIHCTTTSLYTDCCGNLYAGSPSYLLILFSALSAFAVGGLSIERNQKPLAPEITLAVTHHDRQKQVEVKRSSRVNPHEIRLFSGCPYAVVK